MTIETWVKRSPFIRKMMKVFEVNHLRMDVKVKWPMKNDLAKHIYRNRVHWIYSESGKRHSVVHEVLHALKRSTKTNTDVRQYGYDYDPEEYEALWWEIRYMRSTKVCVHRIMRQMIRETAYPREFIETLWDTKLGKMGW